MTEHLHTLTIYNDYTYSQLFVHVTVIPRQATSLAPPAPSITPTAVAVAVSMAMAVAVTVTVTGAVTVTVTGAMVVSSHWIQGSHRVVTTAASNSTPTSTSTSPPPPAHALPAIHRPAAAR